MLLECHMDIQLVAAVDQNGALGKNGTMAWYVPQELRHFKTLTMGGVIIMGRITFESIGRPLPGRVSIVVSSKPSLAPATHPDTYWVKSIEAALALVERDWPDRKVWIGGGANVYAQMLARASAVHLSFMPFTIEGADVFFPPLDPTRWASIAVNTVLDETHKKTLFTYHRYERKTIQ